MNSFKEAGINGDQQIERVFILRGN